ncbi:hypothetical protein PPEP_a2368 [Pseudoalteromonas peptidolytica F12-50-A1]|uniref:Uncharacterized protein n=1 Tax=Pseudoalteromonas peptidolytica F12-50-A1 TaxID=1315280 RepID=A0A8I0MSQ0_9GAMM|nr:hypothetical protein [Pseudoalteromonas peptidolytica F12-50-A1]
MVTINQEGEWLIVFCYAVFTAWYNLLWSLRLISCAVVA